MSKLTPEESLNLKKLVSEYNSEDNTEYIQRVKHSLRIKYDVEIIENMKIQHSDLRKNSFEEFRALSQENAPFLFTNYTDIFNRIIKDELNLEIMYKFLIILKMVEDGRCNQHEGSVAIGKLLKELYLDSAIKMSDHLDEKYKEEPLEKTQEERPISWQQWRNKKEEIHRSLGNSNK